MSVITEIVENKKRIIKFSKEKKDMKQIKKEAFDISSTTNNTFSFQKTMKKNSNTKLIAEFKPASPSMGDISTLRVNDIISIYDKTDVDIISILTEESYFGSKLENIKIAHNLTDKPLLRKDFIIDKYMIYESVINGAGCVLLISNVCPDIENYLDLCNELKLDALVECHTKEDIENATDYGAKIIGINNRNFDSFKIDFNITKNLKKYVKEYLVSESGVQNVEDAKLLKSYGSDAILIGTTLLKNNNLKEIPKYVNSFANILKN